MGRLYAALLLAVTFLAPIRCETRKHFHSRYSSSFSSANRPDSSSRSNSGAYMKTLPLRVLNCLEHVSLVDCGKLYLLQNMEARSYRFANTGNITHDVQEVLLPSYRSADNKLFSDQLLALNGSDVNERLARGLRLLFNERIIDLQLVPGVAVRLTPSATNQLEFSVRKGITAVEPEVAARGKAKKGIRTVLQLSVPLVLLPSMLLAGVLPMILPILKFATIFSSIVNHAALAAAIMYLAKQHAAEQESKQTVYFNAGYN
uniref:Protein osiris 19 n=1 Tax=Anopheles culicifacies TaxID=139723 RepID=A0A182MTI4_9DIPT